MCEFLINQYITHHEFCKYSIVSMFYSTLVFFISFFISKIRESNVLGIEYNVASYLYWILGGVFVWILLDTTKIINRTYIAVLVTTFVWDLIFQKLFSKATETGNGFPTDNISVVTSPTT